MPIKADRLCICVRCGKEYIIKIDDNIKIKDANKMLYCKKCRILMKVLNKEK